MLLAWDLHGPMVENVLEVFTANFNTIFGDMNEGHFFAFARA